MRLPMALRPGKKCSAKRRLTIATWIFSKSTASPRRKSRPSSSGTFIVSKYPGETMFMNICMSSPSFAWCPSTAIELSHSSPARIATVANAADFTPGADAQPVAAARV